MAEKEEPLRMGEVRNNIQTFRQLSEAEQVTVEVEASFVPSIDLVKFAQGHLAFLKQIDDIIHYLRQPHIIANAMRRYENYWLPMISHYADRDSSNFLPPIDVNWVWYVHMLCPRQYRNDCIDVIGMVPDHRFIQGREERTTAQVRTQKLWTSFCVGEKYNIDFSQVDVDTTYHKTSIRYQLAEASFRQLEFNYHVALPHYDLQPFLEHAVQRYLKFINLKRLYKEAQLGPGYDMYLIWQTHQLSPRAYIHDTSHWLGYILNNDDTNMEQGKASKHVISDEETRQIWQELYAENYQVPGSGHRGFDSRGQLYSMTKDQMAKFRSTAAKFSITSVFFDDIDTTSAKGTLTVSLNRLNIGWYDVEKTQVQYLLPLSPSPPPFRWNLDAPALRDIVADGSGKMYVSVKMQTKAAGGCCLSRWTNDAKVDIASSPLSTYINNNETQLFNLEEGHINVSLKGNLQEMPMIFTVSQTGPYKQMIVSSENERQVLGPVLSLPDIAQKIGHTCHVANHVVKSQTGSVFTVKVTHSLSLRTSIVQVYYEDHLVVNSEIIGKEQLPSDEQVEHVGHCITLNPRKIDRAMLIKNDQGDWAMLKGRWEGFKNATSDTGHLIVETLPLTREHLPEVISVLAKSEDPKSPREVLVNLGPSRIDLKNGSIAVKGDCPNIAEQLALSFSVLVLYALCEPRPGDKPGTNRQATGTSTSHFNPGQFSLVEAAGYHAETPSSSYLWWLWQNGEKGLSTNAYLDDNNNQDVVECPWQPSQMQDTQTGQPNEMQSKTGQSGNKVQEQAQQSVKAKDKLIRKPSYTKSKNTGKPAEVQKKQIVNQSKDTKVPANHSVSLPLVNNSQSKDVTPKPELKVTKSDVSLKPAEAQKKQNQSKDSKVPANHSVSAPLVNSSQGKDTTPKPELKVTKNDVPTGLKNTSNLPSKDEKTTKVEKF